MKVEQEIQAWANGVTEKPIWKDGKFLGYRKFATTFKDGVYKIKTISEGEILIRLRRGQTPEII